MAVRTGTYIALRAAAGGRTMSRHIHLPPLLPFVGPNPLEKKEKVRRKPGILTEKTEEDADAKAEEVNPAAAPAAPRPTQNPSPLSGSGGVFSVLLGAQEEAQPVEPAQTGPARKPEEFI
jgi:hypothetical protein